MARHRKPTISPRVTTTVTFEHLSDGSVNITAVGRSGKLALHLHRQEKGDLYSLRAIPSPMKSFLGQWGLSVNGVVKGLLVEDAGGLKWFPAVTADAQHSAYKKVGRPTSLN